VWCGAILNKAISGLGCQSMRFRARRVRSHDGSGAEWTHSSCVVADANQTEHEQRERDRDRFNIEQGGDGSAQHFSEGNTREAGGEEQSSDFEGGFHVMKIATPFALAVPSVYDVR
jgi:hypothetical protein